MNVEDVTIGPEQAPVPAVVARPTTVAGGVIVLQEAFGLTTHIRSICGRLADAGYLAVAPALFHRDGAPVIPYDRMDEARPVMGHLNVADLESDISAAFGFLTDNGLSAAQTGIIGFCMGGSVSLYAATRFDLGAAVTFYGGGVSVGRFGMPPLAELAPSIRCPWLGLFGEQDPGIPMSDIEVLRAGLDQSPTQTELVTYPEAGHGFNCDERDHFVPSAAAAAWQRTIAFFGEHL